MQGKRAEWEKACREYPDLSPFVLLKMSMVWHGAVLTEAALDRLQEPDYCFGKLEPFGISFGGRPADKVMPRRHSAAGRPPSSISIMEKTIGTPIR